MGSLDYETNYGDEENQEQKKALQSIMRKLKSGEYSKVLVGIREKLGLAPKISCVQMEALLIHAAENRFQEDTMARDIVLMSWGLLQGYDNHRTLQEPKDFQTAFAERSEKFLRESSYISKKYKNGEYVSYEVAQAAIITRETKNGKFEGNALKPIREALQKAGEYAINRLADYLYETNMAEYIKKIETQDYFELDYIPSHKLPILLNARDDGPTEESLSADTEQTEDNNSIDPSDKIDECEPETLTDDKSKMLIIPRFLLRPKLPEKQPRQYSPLSPEEVDQFISDSCYAFLNDSKDDDDLAGAALLAEIREEKKERWFMAFKICLFFCIVVVLGTFLLSLIVPSKEIRERIWKYLNYCIIILPLVTLFPGSVYLFLKVSRIHPERKRNFKTRRGYTVQQIKNGVLGKRIVFNSILDGSADSGFKGNEKKFMSVKKVGDESEEWQYGNINVENRSEYLIRVFVHNDNPNGYDAIAKRCRVKIRIPDISSKMAQVCGVICSDNARPREYWDSVTFCNATTPFRLIYDKPAVLCNNGVGQDGYPLSQKIIGSEGAFIGYDYCDGKIPGGDGYESNVLLRVMVKFDTDFTVKFKGNNNYLSGGWWDIVEVDVWGTINFQIGYKNSSNAIEPQKSVKVSIDLPECLCYITRSVFLNPIPRSILGDKLCDDKSLFLHDGLDIGDFNSSDSATIIFSADVVDHGLSSGYNEVLATVKVSVGEVTNYDTVKIIINKE